MYFKFNLQSIVKFLIIVVGWQSFEDDASLVVRREGYCGKRNSLLFVISNTGNYIGLNEKGQEKKEKRTEKNAP